MTDPAVDFWGQAGGTPDALERLTITGPDQALPSIYDVTGLAAGAAGSSTLAASELFRQRTGRAQTATIDRRHAAIAFRSERYLTIDGKPPTNPWDPASGYYPTGDGGLVQLHCNFPHHRSRALGVLGIDDPGDDLVHAVIAEATTDWEAANLEAALGEAEACGAMLRSREEWLATPQGQAAAALPALEVVRLGDGPTQQVGDGARPLGGVRVLDLTRVLAGPVCGRTLASHGADVVRVGAARLPIIESIYPDTSMGKRSCHLDLAIPDDLAVLTGLAGDADVFLQGYRPHALDQFGLSPQELAELRPGIIYASLSAFGHDGPWSSRRGFDSLVQTASGIGRAGAAAAGVAGTRPLPAQALDHGAGWLLALGIMVALSRRAEEGGSWLVRTSLAQVGAWLDQRPRVDSLGLADPNPAAVADLLEKHESPIGTLRHVRPVGDLSDTGPRWDRAPGPFGSDDPVWNVS
ncbi:MAG: CoA transferase [Actinomycetia bacterium]|nr:CoA transferase [Actinomycetes bacterium]